MDIHVLDVTLSDPIVTISGEQATISVEARSRQLDTWEMVDLGRVDVVSLDVGDVTPTVADGVTSWTGIPAATAGSSNEVFAGNYPAGRAVDAVGFSYAGPGGAPDFSEDFDAPGSAKLELADNHIITTDGSAAQYEPWWIDRDRRIVHYRTRSNAGGAIEWTYRAFSLDTLQEVGEPLVLPDEERVASETLFDSTSGRLFYTRANDAETQRWIRFDADQGQYELGTLDTPIPVAGPPSLMWDAVGQRAFNIDLTIPDGVSEDDVDAWEWKLYTYSEQQDGSWTRKTYDLPSFPPGLNLFGYAFNTFLNTPMGAGAADGSLILLGDIQVSLDPEVADPATVPGAYRIVFDEDGDSVSVSPIEGTEVPNGGAHLFTTLQRGPGDELVLMRPESATAPTVQTLSVPAGGSGAQASPPVSVPGLDTTDGNAFAVDRAGRHDLARRLAVPAHRRHPRRRGDRGPVLRRAPSSRGARDRRCRPHGLRADQRRLAAGLRRLADLRLRPLRRARTLPDRDAAAAAGRGRAGRGRAVRDGRVQLDGYGRPRAVAPVAGQAARRLALRRPRRRDRRDARGRGRAWPRRRAVPGAVRERGGPDRLGTGDPRGRLRARASRSTSRAPR